MSTEPSDLTNSLVAAYCFFFLFGKDWTAGFSYKWKKSIMFYSLLVMYMLLVLLFFSHSNSWNIEIDRREWAHRGSCIIVYTLLLRAHCSFCQLPVPESDLALSSGQFSINIPSNWRWWWRTRWMVMITQCIYFIFDFTQLEFWLILCILLLLVKCLFSSLKAWLLMIYFYVISD